jgi:hypothetical protein
MVFSMFDCVTLTQDLPDDGLRVGMVGAIVDMYTKPALAYEVEFADAYGRTIAQLALLPEQFRPCMKGDAIPRHPELPSIK